MNKKVSLIVLLVTVLLSLLYLFTSQGENEKIKKTNKSEQKLKINVSKS